MSEAPLVALSGPEKAAVLILSFGSEQSADLISRLTAREADALAVHLARVQQVDAGIRSCVLEEFTEAAEIPVPQHAPQPARSGDSPESSPPGAAGRQRAGPDEVRPYQYGRLERVPPSPPQTMPSVSAEDLSRLADLTVRCRAQLASLALPVSALRQLSVGDVLLLGPPSEISAHLLAGSRCRLPCRLVIRGQCRAVEVLPEAFQGSEA